MQDIKKYIAEREDGAIFIISEEEADDAAHNTGSDWRSWEEYIGDLPIGAEASAEEVKKNKKYLLIDPCYIGEEDLTMRYGSPIATFRTGDGVFDFVGQFVTVDSGAIHVYKVSPSEDLEFQGDLVDNPFAKVAYLDHCPTQEEVTEVVEDYWRGKS